MQGCSQLHAALWPPRLRGCAEQRSAMCRATAQQPRACSSREAPPSLLHRRDALAAALAAAASCAGRAAASADAALPPACASSTSADGGTGGASYDAYADSYDALNDGPLANAFGLPELRAELLARAQGDVLEIGAGTGLNLPLYRFADGAVRSLTAVDLSGEMLKQARRRATSLGLCAEKEGAQAAPSVRFMRGDATALPFEADSFDTVLDTFSLCVLGDAAPRAIAEMARVVRPRGRVLLLEHSRSGFEPLGAYQDATADAVAATGKGCLWNQRVVDMLPAAGLRVVSRRDALGGTLVFIEAERVAGPPAP